MATKEFTFGFKFAAAVKAEFWGMFRNTNQAIIDLNQNIEKNKGIITALNNAQQSNIIKYNNATKAVEAYSNQIKKLEQQQRNLSKIQIGKQVAKTVGYYEAAKKSFGFGKSVFGAPAKEAMEFQASMNKVEALMNESPEVAGKNREALEKLALQLGKKLPYSAKEAADSMSFLAMAGWKTDNITAGLPSLMKLAMAGGTDLARTADILSDDLTAFGLEADQSGRMANVFATVITNTNTDIEKLGETMKYAAPVANAFGASLEETAAMAGLMASAGVKASQAGTALRSGFLRLAGPPKKAREAMEKLGMSMSDISNEQKEAEAALAGLDIKVGDLQGPKRMIAILSQLRTKISALKTKDQQMAITKAIFGTEASTGWLNLFKAKDGQFEELIAKLEKSKDEGNLDKIADKMTKGAKGSATQFSSAVNNLQIALGTKLLPMFTSVTVIATEFIDTLSSINEKYPGFVNAALGCTLAVTGFVFAISASKAVYNAAVTAHLAYTFVMKTSTGQIIANTAKTIWNTSAKVAATVATWGLTGAIGAMTMAAKILGGAINLSTQFIGLMRTGFVKLFAVLMANPWIALATVAVGAAILIWENWDTIKQWFITLWDNPKLALQQFVDGVKNLLGDAFKWIKEKWENIGKLLSVPIFGKVNIAAEGTKKANPDVAHNAAGGIYAKGTFLTTFAEKSPEAAIPIDGSKRATNLWMQTGKLMGLLPKGLQNVEATRLTKNISSSEVTNLTRNIYNTETNNLTKNISNSDIANLTKNIDNSSVTNMARNFSSIYNTTSNEAVNQIPGDLLRKTENITSNTRHGDNVNVTFNPQITINGNADNNTAEMIKQALREEEAKFERRFKEMLSRQRRLSYA